MLNLSPVWLFFVAIALVVLLLAFRLGFKAANLSETEIINHYSAHYIASGTQGEDTRQLTDCYAIAGDTLWTRLEVICVNAVGQAFHYKAGPWGNLLNMTSEHAPSFENET